MIDWLRKNKVWAGATIYLLALLRLAFWSYGSRTGRPLMRLIPFASFYDAAVCLMEDCRRTFTSFFLIVINGFGNVAVFIPLGALFCIGLASRRRPVAIATLFCVLISLFIEITQYWIPGRVVATDDVILNLIGGWIGAMLVSLVFLKRRALHESSSVA